jgi:hypothetical protein
MTNPDDDANAAAKAAAKKVRGKPFPKGRSGNPVGKRRGTRHRKTIWIEAMSEGDREAIIAKVLKLAKAGDRAALRMVVDRIEPIRRGRPIAIDLPPIVVTSDAVAAMGKIAATVSAGKISPSEAIELSAVVDAARKSIELLDVERRLATLEERFK